MDVSYDNCKKKSEETTYSLRLMLVQEPGEQFRLTTIEFLTPEEVPFILEM